MSVTVIVGEQRGDEGKGRFADMLAEEHDIVARFNGGANAGHTVVLPDGRDLALHLMPSGIAHPHVMNVIGNGTVVDPLKLNVEIQAAKEKGIEISEDQLMISSAAHLILPHHISQDELREAGSTKQGTTQSGIAPVYADKAMRSGVRMEIINNDIDKLAELIMVGIEQTNAQREAAGLEKIDAPKATEDYIASAAKLCRFITDTTLYLNRRLRAGDSILAEGAQAFLLDIDHGMYDAVTSSSTTTGGVMTGLGIPYSSIDRVVGVSKAVQSHVGGGPFATEIEDENLLARLHGRLDQVDSETGTTTGRKRRLGHLDLAAIKRAQMINGTTEMVLTKLDWVPRYGRSVLVCTGYERKGKSLEVSPDAAYKIEQSTPVYEELPTWQGDVSDVRRFQDLPKNARNYIHFIEEAAGLPVSMIGVGPRRDQVIIRN